MRNIRRIAIRHVSYSIMIHSADPQSQPDSDHYFHICHICPHVCTSVATFQNLAKQNNFQVKINCDRYYRDCGSGRGDHWWHLSDFPYLSSYKNSLSKKKRFVHHANQPYFLSSLNYSKVLKFEHHFNIFFKEFHWTYTNLYAHV